MESKYPLLILKNKAKLNKMIRENAPYEKILHQSHLLDKYINIQICAMSKTKD